MRQYGRRQGRLNLVAPEWLCQALKVEARREKRSMSNLIVILLEQALKQRLAAQQAEAQKGQAA